MNHFDRWWCAAIPGYNHWNRQSTRTWTQRFPRIIRGSTVFHNLYKGEGMDREKKITSNTTLKLISDTTCCGCFSFRQWWRQHVLWNLYKQFELALVTSRSGTMKNKECIVFQTTIRIMAHKTRGLIPLMTTTLAAPTYLVKCLFAQGNLFNRTAIVHLQKTTIHEQWTCNAWKEHELTAWAAVKHVKCVCKKGENWPMDTDRQIW